MHLSGPMPGPMRAAILGFFALVFGMTALPVCLGVPLWTLGAASVVGAHAPLPDDLRMARELEARAAEQGVELDVTPADIAQARRLGQLDQIEQVADELFPATPQPPPAPRRSTMEGVFHPEEHVQAPPAAPFPWGLAAAAATLLLVAIGSVAGAVASLVVRQGAPAEP